MHKKIPKEAIRKLADPMVNQEFMARTIRDAGQVLIMLKKLDEMTIKTLFTNSY